MSLFGRIGDTSHTCVSRGLYMWLLAYTTTYFVDDEMINCGFVKQSDIVTFHYLKFNTLLSTFAELSAASDWSRGRRRRPCGRHRCQLPRLAGRPLGQGPPEARAPRIHRLQAGNAVIR